MPDPEIVLRAGELAARFLPAAGMVGASLTHRGEELLGRRGGLAAYRERGSTFGIPLLHPWANRLGGDAYAVSGRRVELPERAPGLKREEHGLPIHGLLGATPGWRVQDADETVLRASFAFAGPALLALFPFPHELRLVVALDAGGLTVTTQLDAGRDAAVPVAFGWHPYLTLPGTPRREWRLELPARRKLLADERGLPTGERRDEPAQAGPFGERTFDDGYDGLAPGAVLALSDTHRRLAVELVEGFPVAQVFAPPRQELVALEPMTAPVNALGTGDGLRLVAPGERFTATFRILVGDT